MLPANLGCPPTKVPPVDLEEANPEDGEDDEDVEHAARLSYNEFFPMARRQERRLKTEAYPKAHGFRLGLLNKPPKDQLCVVYQDRCRVNQPCPGRPS